jgi:hypothetical protein
MEITAQPLRATIAQTLINSKLNFWAAFCVAKNQLLVYTPSSGEFSGSCERALLNSNIVSLNHCNSQPKSTALPTTTTVGVPNR